MSNLNVNCGRAVLLLATTVAALLSFHTIVVDCRGAGGEAEVKWQILTKLNYSSQIRLHPRLLLLVTVPWCGESMSLMKELADVVANDQQVKFRTLKLMVIYKNVERMLADALGATDGISIFYYHNALSYKYSGKLRGRSILFSVNYVMSRLPEELPLRSLTTSDELEDFFDSTDKAVLLLEFCGWTPRLLAMNKTTTGNEFAKSHPDADDNEENNGTLAAEENMKAMKHDKLSSGIDNGFTGASWRSLTTANGGPAKKTEKWTLTYGDSCTSYEFQRFEMFLPEFITVAREFFLPPERLKFGLVRERSLLPFLNIEEQETSSWLLTLLVAGCPSCSKIFREGDDLTSFLGTRATLVLELEDDLRGVETALPANRPSVLLFVDRSSNSMQRRRESQVALNAFRELAYHYEMSNQMLGQASVRLEKTLMETNRASRSAFKHPRLQSFPASQQLIMQDKMSIVIMNDGQQVTLESLVPDLQTSSVHDILNYALKQKRQLKLSSLAKDAGFQLLSKDFNVEVVESLPHHSPVQSIESLGEIPGGAIHQVADMKTKEMPVSASKEDLPDPSDVEYIILENKEDSLDKSSQSSVESQHAHHSAGIPIDDVRLFKVEERCHSGTDETDHEKDFTGSFIFFDGQYRLLETLTGESKIPSIVITDPISQQHYVLNGHSVFSYPLLLMFINDFIAGKLPPYLQSAPTVSPRDAQRPPFVNLDFHETNSIPLVTSRTFAELVLGNKSGPHNSSHSWSRNVLVLFSNSWCGFCQRMELAVREVYRTIKSYATMKMNGSRKEKMILTDNVGDAILKLPLIYMMDCTRNDCSLIIKQLLQREVYPVLLFFLAERKDTPVSYEGDITVSDIIKFLAAQGNHVLDLIMDKK